MSPIQPQLTMAHVAVSVIGALFVGVLVMRALLELGALILGNSHIELHLLAVTLRHLAQPFSKYK